MALPYTLYKSDPTKISQAITVPVNGTNDTDTSLTFIGPNAPSFGTAVNEDFLYLLENFANTTPPLHPTQGQLWYDTSNGKATGFKLRVYDNVNWNPVAGVWQQSTAPDGGVNPGDIWVDISQGQLFITLDGSTWNLVGPTYSTVLKTGSYPEVLTDTAGVSHRVIKNYIDDNVIEIIASETFIPNPPIQGFTTGLAPGLNLSSTYNSTLNATAKIANALILANGTSVSGNSLVRTDIDSTINATLNVSQINIGTGTIPWSISQNGSQAIISNLTSGGKISFKVTTVGVVPVTTEYLTVDGTKESVLVGPNASLQSNATLAVGGSINAIAITATNLISTTGTVQTSNLNVTSTATIGTLVTTSTSYIGGNIVPSTSGTYNIGVVGGSNFNQIIAREFVGSFTGPLTGSASSLTNATTFSISGDISSPGFTYNGQPPSGASGFVFSATVQSSIISNKPLITSVANTSAYILVLNNGSLCQILKNNFLSDIVSELVPTGTIIPFAGLNAPSGYLFCDGAYVSISTYSALYNVIGYTYGIGEGINAPMRLPDLRSRMIMGFDDMNNYNLATPLIGTSAGTLAGRTSNLTPNKPLASIGQAPLVAGQYTMTTGTSTLYYHAMNYIIKT